MVMVMASTGGTQTSLLIFETKVQEHIKQEARVQELARATKDTITKTSHP